MRRRSFSIVLAVVAAVGSPWAGGEELAPLPVPGASSPDPSVVKPVSVRADVQMVSVSVADARALVPAFENRKTAGEAWTRLQSMIVHGDAKLMAWPVLWLRNGYRGFTESILEDRYATEFVAPRFPQIFGGPEPKIPSWGPNAPTAFETRNLGAILEAEVSTEPASEIIDLDFRSEFSRRTETREWLTQASPLGVAGVMQQPFFQTAKTTTSVRIHRAEPCLVGVFVLVEPNPHVELHILHAQVKPLPPNVPRPPNP
jgi:hypothetical protein